MLNDQHLLLKNKDSMLAILATYLFSYPLNKQLCNDFELQDQAQSQVEHSNLHPQCGLLFKDFHLGVECNGEHRRYLYIQVDQCLQHPNLLNPIDMLLIRLEF